MKFNRAEIKDIERLQKYERIFAYLLKKNSFTKPDIWKCRENKQLIRRTINDLIPEGVTCPRTWPIISPPEDYVEESERLAEFIRKHSRTEEDGEVSAFSSAHIFPENVPSIK